MGGDGCWGGPAFCKGLQRGVTREEISPETTKNYVISPPCSTHEWNTRQWRDTVLVLGRNSARAASDHCDGQLDSRLYGKGKSNWLGGRGLRTGKPVLKSGQCLKKLRPQISQWYDLSCGIPWPRNLHALSGARFFDIGNIALHRPHDIRRHVRLRGG